MTSQAKEVANGFQALGLEADVLEELQRRKIFEPTPIQKQAIPQAVEGNDVIGIAQTGTGKTLAFLLPVIQQLMHKPNAQALVVVPTRELATQVQQACEWFERSHRMHSALIIGGASMGQQLQQIKRKPRFIIATPGRLIDHLKQRTISLERVEHVILDEADRMFDMGFAPQIKEILEHVRGIQDRQTLLFSATMPDAITRLVVEHMKSPVRIEISTPGSTGVNIEQEMIVVDNAHRKGALQELLRKHKGAVLVFTRTKHQAKQLTQWLRDNGERAEELHSNRSQHQRNKAIEALQSKRSRIMIATDVAARGIDIPHLELVVNFELPDNPEDYVHRIGRTGRAGKLGKAISFVLSDQASELNSIQRLIDATIPQAHLETVPSAELIPHSKPKARSFGGRNGGRRSFGGGGFSGGRSGGSRSGGSRSGGHGKIGGGARKSSRSR